jgi:hypothetical protein
MSEFIPPRMDHVIIDEETQMQKYLAEIAMEDLLLLSGTRRERPNGLMAQYKRNVAVDLAAEAVLSETKMNARIEARERAAKVAVEEAILGGETGGLDAELSALEHQMAIDAMTRKG